jgi:hypothetical protein
MELVLSQEYYLERIVSYEPHPNSVVFSFYPSAVLDEPGACYFLVWRVITCRNGKFET